MPDEIRHERWLTRSDVIALLTGLIGIGVSFLGILLTGESRKALFSLIQQYVFPTALVIGGLALVIGTIYAVLRTRQLPALERDLKQAKAELAEYARVSNLRLENIADKPIKFGHVAYEPFLTYDAGGRPQGFGVDLLRELLDVEILGKRVLLQADPVRRNWITIFQGLEEGAYDVVATPLIPTSDRNLEIDYTAPLFFSNVGLYFSGELAQYPAWHHAKASELTQLMSAYPNLRLLAVRGEVSLVKARECVNENDFAKRVEVYDSDTSLHSLFDRIAQSKGVQYGIFCESFFASQNSCVMSGSVRNTLSPHQILYPVCFALRSVSQDLKYLLDLRISELTRKRKNIDLLALYLRENGQMTKEELDMHFVSRWPTQEQFKTVVMG